MMDKNQELLLKLVNSQNEQEVEQILETDSYAKTLSWWPFNGDEGNFSTINNQQTDPIAALTEKPINSIDSLLTLKCRLAGIDPESAVAPKCMSEAVEKFFGIKDGDISTLDEKQRRDLAKGIRLIAEGDKDKPNIVCIDFGEGQHPSCFKTTLLSLHKRNKSKIAFVQGKYGMGGTGVIPFCGSNKYQLILSRKHPKLLEKGQQDIWGFTLVRKTPASKLSARDKHSWFECLADTNKDMLTFGACKLPILPDSENIEYGVYIKLFNYDLPRASFVTTDLWRDLNRRLFAPALPILIQEDRTKVFNITKGKNDTKILIGNKFRIKKDDRKFVNQAFPITADLKNFDLRKIDVVVFKDFDDKGEDLRKRQEWTTIDETVFFTINGQTHYSLPRYWLKKTNLDFLADYLFIHIDCTNVSRAVTDDIFLGSRDRVRNNTGFREVQEELASILGKNEVLLKLNEEYRQRQLANIKVDKSIAKQIVANLVSKNINLKAYFGLGADVPLSELGNKDIPEKFEGVCIPTFLRIKKKFSGDILVKEMPQNARHAIILLETDAQNDYFDRKEDSGKLTWKSDDSKAKVSVWYLFNGLLPIRINVADPKEGEIFDFDVAVSRPNSEPLSVSFKVKIVAAEIKSSHEHREEPKQEGVALPELIIVKEKSGENNETWDQHNWSGADVAKTAPGRIYVNMDSDDLKNSLSRCPKRLQNLAETIYKVGIYINSIVLDAELDKKLQNGDKAKVFSAAITSASKTLLPIFLDPEIQKIATKE